MSQRIYGLVYDCGDGSASIHWYRKKAIVDKLLDSDDSYNLNEGVPNEVLTFPDEVNLEVCGFSFSDDDLELEDLEDLDLDSNEDW